jgi:hypothetical protein
MITMWLVKVFIASLLLGGAALICEKLSRWHGRATRFWWIIAMSACVLLPAAASVAPGILPSLPLFRDNHASGGTAVLSAAEPTEEIAGMWSGAGSPAAPVSSRRGAALLWIGISSAAACFLLIGRIRLSRELRTFEVEMLDGLPVRMTMRTGPMVVGLLRPEIVVPQWVKGESPAARAMILKHERSHVAAHDQWLLAAGALALVVAPWNAALWWIMDRMRNAIETDCDARVLATGVCLREYGDTLIRAASESRGALFAPGWRPRRSGLEMRLRSLTAVPPRARLLQSVALAGLVLALALAACDVVAPDMATTAATTASARSSANPPQTYFELPGPAHVRVTGKTSQDMKARLVVSGYGARLRVLSAGQILRTVGDSVIEFRTPALFRVEGTEYYSLVASSLDGVSEVEIHATSPAASRTPRAASASGPAPQINFSNLLRSLDLYLPEEVRVPLPPGSASGPAPLISFANLPRRLDLYLPEEVWVPVPPEHELHKDLSVIRSRLAALGTPG